MTLLRTLRYAYLSYLSQPASDRPLWRAVHRERPQSIVQIGMANRQRTSRLLEIALWHHPDQTLRFVGIDLFESRTEKLADLTLRQIHAELKPQPIKLQLVPGDPLSALARTANAIPGNDLLLVHADQDPDSMREAWFFIPRILHDRSIVFLEQGGRWTRLTQAEIQSLASASSRSRRKIAA
ncbi:MAG: hypothetical protein FJ295_17740 [Planctomycetes bacterium]|nr:hypothetical protein [Planctomycetota bacterium]